MTPALLDSGVTWSSSARTLSMAFSSTFAMPSIDTCCDESPRPAAWLTTTAMAAYGNSSSRASTASGMPVMPTSVAPSRSIRSISAAVSSRGPDTAP